MVLYIFQAANLRILFHIAKFFSFFSIGSVFYKKSTLKIDSLSDFFFIFVALNIRHLN